MEESAQRCICPFLGFPPLGLFPLVLGFGDGVARKRQIDDLEEESTPRHKAFRGLLMCTEVDDDGRLVRLENEVQHGWDLLSGRGRCVQHAARDGDEGREELLHDERKVILALTIPARPSVKPTKTPQPAPRSPKRTHTLERGDAPRADLTNITAVQQRVHALQQPGPPLWEIMRDEIFECGAKLHGDRPRWGSREDAQDGRFERVTIGLRDRGLFWTCRGDVEDVRGVDTVFEVDGTRLTGGAGWVGERGEGCRAAGWARTDRRYQMR